MEGNADTVVGPIPTPIAAYHSTTEAGWWVRFETRDGDWLSCWVPEVQQNDGSSGQFDSLPPISDEQRTREEMGIYDPVYPELNDGAEDA